MRTSVKLMRTAVSRSVFPVMTTMVKRVRQSLARNRSVIITLTGWLGQRRGNGPPLRVAWTLRSGLCLVLR